MNELPLYLTVKEAAGIANIAYTTMIFHVRVNPDLHAEKHGKSYRIPTEAFARWLMAKQA